MRKKPRKERRNRRVFKMALRTRVEKGISIDDGAHKGKITKVETKDVEVKSGTATYLEIFILEEESGVELKAGMPFRVTENTSLGMVLANFGAELQEDLDIDIEEFIKPDMKVTFLTKTEKTPKGKFAVIINDTLKPAK